MPHSTNPSQSSQHTFDLDIEGDRPMTSTSSPQSKGSSSYGVALTSTPSHDERAQLPSQREKPMANRRKSAPGTHTYAEVIENAVHEPFDELLLQRRPGDRSSTRSYSYNDTSKRKSQYYDEQFQYKDNAMGLSKEKVHRQSPVIAELKTNVIIKDEFTLVTDLSHHLAQRYTRPDSCIMIKVDHSACLALGGNFEPCYFLTLNVIPSQMGSSTNKRNAALIQSFMAEILSVPAERGILTFQAIPEENVAQNGVTMLAEMERVEKQRGTDSNGIKNAFTEATRKSMTFNKKSTPMLNGDMKSNGNLTAESTNTQSMTPPPQVGAGASAVSQLYNQPSTANTRNERPSTAHGTMPIENPLRMNGISTDQLVGANARTPNGRPKTFGAPEPASMQESIKREPLPHVSRQTSSQTTTQVQRTGRPENRKSMSSTSKTLPLAPGNGPLPSRPVPASRTSTTATTSSTAPASKSKHTPIFQENRAKNTYLDNVSSLGKKGAEPAIVVTNEDDDDVPLSKTAAANTAKRRSTITATPKLPLKPPPPVPEETRSVSSKLGKRKSFLKMFKRTSVPAWYE